MVQYYCQVRLIMKKVKSQKTQNSIYSEKTQLSTPILVYHCSNYGFTQLSSLEFENLLMVHLTKITAGNSKYGNTDMLPYFELPAVILVK